MSRFTHTLTLGLVALTLTVPALAAPAPAALPKGAALRPFHFPAWQEVTLKNGLSVAIVEQGEQPVVSLRLAARSGSLADPAGKAGLASLTGELWSKESRTRKADDVAEAFDFLGASFGSGADRDSTSMSTKLVSRHLATALPLMAEVATQPGFSQAEFDLAKANRLSGLKQNRDRVDVLADEALLKGIFGQHPFAILPSGTAASVQTLTLADVRAFARQHYTPQNSLLVVAGDVHARTLVPQLEKAFGSWKGTAPAAPKTAAIPAPKPTRILLIDKPGAVQSALAVGTRGITQKDPDYYPLLVANSALGGNFISRLNSNLREDKGYTYGAGSRLATTNSTGFFRAKAEVETSVTAPALREMLKEITRFGKDPLTAHEFQVARDSMIGEFPLSVETADQIAGWVANQKLNGLPSSFVRTYREKLAAVTIPQVQAAYRKLIQGDKLVVIVCGDASKIGTALAKLGPVETIKLAKTP